MCGSARPLRFCFGDRGLSPINSKVGLGFLSHRSLGMDPMWGSHEERGCQWSAGRIYLLLGALGKDQVNAI